MTKPTVPNFVSFPAWAKTECISCGREYQVTRTQPKTIIEDECLCDICDQWEKGYKEGVRDTKQNFDNLGADGGNVAITFTSSEVIGILKDELTKPLYKDLSPIVLELLCEKIKLVESYKVLHKMEEALNLLENGPNLRLVSK